MDWGASVWVPGVAGAGTVPAFLVWRRGAERDSDQVPVAPRPSSRPRPPAASPPRSRVSNHSLYFQIFYKLVEKRDTLGCCEDIINVGFVGRESKARLHEASWASRGQNGVEGPALPTGNPSLSSISASVIVKKSLFNLIIGNGRVGIRLTSKVTVPRWLSFDECS